MRYVDSSSPTYQQRTLLHYVVVLVLCLSVFCQTPGFTQQLQDIDESQRYSELVDVDDHDYLTSSTTLFKPQKSAFGPVLFQSIMYFPQPIGLPRNRDPPIKL